MLNMARAQGDALLEKAANRLKTDYVDKGKLGRASGEGFIAIPIPLSWTKASSKRYNIQYTSRASLHRSEVMFQHPMVSITHTLVASRW